MQYGISAIEVMFNMFRLKPLEELFPMAKEKMLQSLLECLLQVDC